MIIIKYFEELEEEFKVFSDLTFKEFSKDKHLDNPELKGYILQYNLYSPVGLEGHSLKNIIYHLNNYYKKIDDEVAIQIIIEVLEKYYE